MFGCLGLGTDVNIDTPMRIQALSSEDIIQVSCGEAHSAAVTRSGKLYTWGKASFGRLGHADRDDQMKPRCDALAMHSPVAHIFFFYFIASYMYMYMLFAFVFMCVCV